MNETPSQDKAQLREVMKDREDLRPIISAMLAGTYVPALPREALDQNLSQWVKLENGRSDIDIREAKKIWGELKSERNALITIFAEEAWGDFKEWSGADDYDSNSRLSGDDIVGFERWTADVFGRGLAQWQKKRDERLLRPSQEWDTRDRLYERYRAIIDFGTRNVVTEDSPASFIARGVSTAATVTWRLAKMIPRLAQKGGLTLTKPQALACLRRAYFTVVAQFMSMHKNIAVPLIEAMESDDGFTMEMFSLEERDGAYRLAIDHEKLFQITDDEGKVILARRPDTETTWCPARYSTGEGVSMLQEYFEWTLHIAERFYPPIAQLPGVQA